jgi:hypothetical protein
MISRLRRTWYLPMCLCCLSLALALLYLFSDNALGQIPPTYGYGEPTVQFSSDSYTVNEGDTATITVTLSAVSSQDVFVSYATSDGTGQGGVDYTPTSGTLYIPAGTASQSFNVSTMTNPSNTSYVTVNLTLNSPSNAMLGSPSTATLYIVNPSACGN